jgi:hypothetical protein
MQQIPQHFSVSAAAKATRALISLPFQRLAAK